MSPEKSISYYQKFRGSQVMSGMPYPKWRESLIVGLGGAITIAMLYALTTDLKIVPCFLVPLGASCGLVIGAPAVPVAQPRNVILGNVLSALIGLLVFRVFGQAVWWTLALAVGIAMAAMTATKTYHPPAAVTVLLPLLTKITDFTWVMAPVGVGAVMVVLVGLLYNNIYAGRRYPSFWW